MQRLSAGHQIFTRAPCKGCWTLLKGIPGCGPQAADLRLIPEHDTKLTVDRQIQKEQIQKEEQAKGQSKQ